MRVYLAATYERNAEMRKYREELATLGHTVTSHWIDVALEREPVAWGPEKILERTEEAQAFASTDLADIYKAEMVIFFSEGAKPSSSRGGRHVEFGYALAFGIPITLIGPYENVFSSHATRRFDRWEDMISSWTG